MFRATAVHPLLVCNEEEKRVFEQGAKNKIRRLEEAKQSLLTTAPTLQEKDIVHSLFLNTLDSRQVEQNTSNLPVFMSTDNIDLMYWK